MLTMLLKVPLIPWPREYPEYLLYAWLLVFGTLLRRMLWSPALWLPAQLTTLPLPGSTSLDQALEGPYKLLVQVKDMGDQASGHQATATIDVSIVENTWVPLDPVHLAENLKVLYPHHIAQVSEWLSVAEVAPQVVQLGLSLVEIWGDRGRGVWGPSPTCAPPSTVRISFHPGVGHSRPQEQTHSSSPALLWQAGSVL